MTRAAPARDRRLAGTSAPTFRVWGCSAGFRLRRIPASQDVGLFAAGLRRETIFRFLCDPFLAAHFA